MPRLTDSPSPVPLTSGFVVKNGSKIRSRCSGAMPGPVSAKAIRTPPFAVWVRTISEPQLDGGQVPLVAFLDGDGVEGALAAHHRDDLLEDRVDVGALGREVALPAEL